jgi:hypothetical protein
MSGVLYPPMGCRFFSKPFEERHRRSL